MADTLEQGDVTISVNGEQRRIASELSVAGLLAALSLDSRKVAVERNLAIVPRSLYGQTRLCDADQIEIVHFIGGG
jgi:thiamine biosynthesis protein ThiS